MDLIFIIHLHFSNDLYDQNSVQSRLAYVDD